MAEVMEETNNNISDEDDELCVVCCKDIQICSIMDCQHTICHECSTRLRVLCEKLECPICRQKTTMALFSSQRGPFQRLIVHSLYTDEKYKLAFEDARARQAFERLLAHQCPCCTGEETFSTFQQLRQHVTSEHGLFYCDICVTHLKLFNKERKLYTRELLEHHHRKGDAGDDSYSGHPLCDLCQQRYVDQEELYLHLRRDHHPCHLCEADGQQAFFRDALELQDHFRRKHYLCEEGECKQKRLIVFRTNIDLQAHRAAAHASGGGRRRRQGPPVLTLQFSSSGPAAARRRRAQRLGSPEAPSPPSPGMGGMDWPEFPPLSSVINAASAAHSAFSAAFPSSTTNAFPTNAFPTSSSAFPGASATGGGGGTTATSKASTAQTSASVGSPVTSTSGVSFNVNRRPAQTNVTINVSRRTTTAGTPGSAGVGSPTTGSPQPRISQVSSSGNITMQSPTMEQPPLIRGGRLVNDLESLYGTRQAEQQPPPPQPQTTTGQTTGKAATAAAGKAVAAAAMPQSPIEESWRAGTGRTTSMAAAAMPQSPGEESWRGGGDGPSPPASPPVPSPLLTRGAVAVPGQGAAESPQSPPTTPRSLQPQQQQSTSQQQPQPRNYFGTNSVRFSVSGGGWTAPTVPPTVPPSTPPTVPPTAPQTVPPTVPPTAPPSFAPPPAPPTPELLRLSLRGRDREPDPDPEPEPEQETLAAAAPPHRLRYRPPENLNARSSKLAKEARELCRSEEALRNFRQLSAEFRHGHISGEQYYSRCLSLLGSERFSRMFPELLVLLPDIEKQTELLSAHEALNKDGTHRHKFLRCPTCCQVLTLSDWGRHSELHFRNGEFPPEAE